MTKDEVIAEFGEAILQEHNFFARSATRPKEVGIVASQSGFDVYKTDERGVVAGPRHFSDVAEALDFFAVVLRGYYVRNLNRAE